MYSDSKTLPGDSRVWVYQANRKLTADEENKIQELGIQFVNGWTAHNRDLRASFEIRHHLFLIFMVDQSHAGASGCSIDKSVHFIQQLEKQFGITLLDRMNIACNVAGEIQVIKLHDFGGQFKSGKINSDTVVFNNLVEKKWELETNWEVPVSKSWHKQLVG